MKLWQRTMEKLTRNSQVRPKSSSEMESWKEKVVLRNIAMTLKCIIYSGFKQM